MQIGEGIITDNPSPGAHIIGDILESPGHNIGNMLSYPSFISVGVHVASTRGVLKSTLLPQLRIRMPPSAGLLMPRVTRATTIPFTPLVLSHCASPSGLHGSTMSFTSTISSSWA
ncbi:MAG: hypothetical protein ACD_21C00128G0002 [uncultured bacterium]|nr:MAG: hypothetical protein ACD_21C00128G0002 [uncultured bacterium]